MNALHNRRVSLKSFPVRELLDEYKRAHGIPFFAALDNKQRDDFELWAISEGRRRGIDVFADEDYRKGIMRANVAYLKKTERRF